MLYPESRARSAELLRMVVGFMQQHAATFNPITYTVWYEYAAGTNVRLNQALDQLQKSEPRLGDASIQRLYREHIAGVDQASMDRVSRDFLNVMSKMAESAQDTGRQAGHFGARLDALSHSLSAHGGEAIIEQISQVMHQTSAMRESTTELQAQVEAGKQEIDKLRVDLERAREEALIDGLTRTLNRKGLDLHLERLLAQPLPSGKTHSLVMVDVDHFKRLNDNHGHLVGDQVLGAVAQVLNQVVRLPEQQVARYGGEEFVLLLPHTPLERARHVAEQACERMRQLRLRKRSTQKILLEITVSAGAASLLPGESAQDWLARADAALYQSKQAGRDRVTCAA